MWLLRFGFEKAEWGFSGKSCKGEGAAVGAHFSLTFTLG